MDKLRKSLYFLPLLIWMSLPFLDVFGFIHREQSPFFFRAWEYSSNYTGKDGYLASFKPMSTYKGTMTGDLLNAIEFTPKPEEIRNQEFIVDEYGYRNRPGFLDTPIDAVVLGSSFVAGGQETQENLISEILTRDHNIRTYNSSTSLQYFWDDFRFKKNPPKYVFVVGPEGELISSLWKFTIEDRTPYNVPQKWNSYQEWKQHNEVLPETFEKWMAILKQYSLVRYIAVQAHAMTLNRLYSREQIANQTTQEVVTYYPQTGMLFWQENYDVPLLGSEGKKIEDINTAIDVFKNSKKRLAEQNVRLILVAMPSKTHAEMGKYQSIPDEKNVLFALNTAFKQAKLEYVDMNKAVQEYRKSHSEPLYYPDDSHWNSQTNYLISNEIGNYLKTRKK